MQVGDVLVRAPFDRERVAARIDGRIVEWLERHLQHDLVALATRRLHPPTDAVALRREGKRHFPRQLLDRFLGAGLGNAEPADDHCHAGPTRTRPRPGIDINGSPTIRRTYRQWACRRLLDQRLVRQMRHAQVLADVGRVPDDNGARPGALFGWLHMEDRRSGAIAGNAGRLGFREGRALLRSPFKVAAATITGRWKGLSRSAMAVDAAINKTAAMPPATVRPLATKRRPFRVFPRLGLAERAVDFLERWRQAFPRNGGRSGISRRNRTDSGG